MKINLFSSSRSDDIRISGMHPGQLGHLHLRIEQRRRGMKPRGTTWDLYFSDVMSKLNK